MASQDSTIPRFRNDGYLPPGLYPASKAEVLFRFGSLSSRRRRLTLRIRRWIELARLVGGLRLLIDGSFVTAKPEPDDIVGLLIVLNTMNRIFGMDRIRRRHLDEFIIAAPFKFKASPQTQYIDSLIGTFGM